MKNELNIIPSASEPTTITILEGKALEQKPIEPIHVVGNINAISSFLNVRKDTGSGIQKIDASKILVEVNDKDMQIDLYLDPENHYSTQITARLELSDEIKAFCINGQQTMTREAFVKLLRFNRLRFLDPMKHEEVLKAVQAFTFQAEVNSGASADTRGNKTSNLTKTVNSNIPNEFILRVPIFKGQPALSFRVEICLDTTEGSARFWLESVELAELIEIERDKIFATELKSCEGFVIIRK